MLAIDERITAMSEAELDALPFGVVRLDRYGNVLAFNRVEAEFANRTREATIGGNFFIDVAPCTAVREFQGRFEEFVESTELQTEPFAFLFLFGWTRRQVRITMLRNPADTDSVFIVVDARAAPE